MNVPSQNAGNWRWRFKSEMLTEDLASKMALLAEVTDRLPESVPDPDIDEAFA